MSKEMQHSSENTAIPSAFSMLFQNFAGQQPQEEIERLKKENVQLKNAVLIQHEAYRQQKRWLVDARDQNAILHNRLKTITKERDEIKKQLSLIVRFLCNLKRWLNTITFAIHFPSRTTQCNQIDKLLFDKVLIPRLLAITSPAKLSTTEAMTLLKELQQTDHALKDEIRAKYADKVWLALSKLLYLPHLKNGFISNFQFFETFCRQFWPKGKLVFPTDARVNHRLTKAIHTTQLMLLAMQDQSNKDLVIAILEFITQHFNVTTITAEEMAKIKQFEPKTEKGFCNRFFSARKNHKKKKFFMEQAAVRLTK